MCPKNEKREEYWVKMMKKLKKIQLLKIKREQRKGELLMSKKIMKIKSKNCKDQ